MKQIIYLILVILPVASIHAQNAGTLITAKKGMVVCASEEASKVGIEILKKGGNAVDAAVAVGFALAVTYPSAGNLGGGMYMVIRTAKGEVTTIDAREVAPMGAQRDMYLDVVGKFLRDKAMNGPIAAGVPGTVDGLLKAHALFGKMKRAALIAPAITLASDGFQLHPRTAGLFKSKKNELDRYPSSRRVFMKNGEPYVAGDLWRQPDLAGTLKLISEKGRDGFYRGPVAEMIVAEMKRGGGVMTLEDLRRYAAIAREPVLGEYRDYRIISVGPSSSGGIALIQLLNILEQYDLKSTGHNSVKTIQWMVEAMKHVYADRSEHLGDPDFVDVPVEWLISKEYAAQIRNRIVDGRPTPSSEINPGVNPRSEGRHTTHFTVVDRWGNAVSATTTINSPLGGKCVVDGAGFLLNNEMDDFSAKPGVPNSDGLVGGEANSIAPVKRMLSSMAPTIITKNGKLFMTVGTPGGATIITTILQIVLNVIDHGMSLPDAIDAGRIHHQWLPDEITYEEKKLSSDIVRRLSMIGYKLKEVNQSGRIEAIMYDARKKVYHGCSDPRGYGAAMGY